MLYLIEEQYLFYLSEQERERILQRDKEKLLKLLNLSCKRKDKIPSNYDSFLIILTQLGDINAKQILKDKIIQAFNTGDIRTLNFLNQYHHFDDLTEAERKSVYYKNNTHVKFLVDKSLENKYTIKEFAIPALTFLSILEDPSAKLILKRF